MAIPRLVLDSHVDIPWPDPPNPRVRGPRRVDIPKMQEGGMSAACFVAFVPQTSGEDAERTHAWLRANAMLDHIWHMGQEGDDGRVRVCTSAHLIEDDVAAGALVVIPVVENAHALGGQLKNVRILADRGVRYITLTHNGHNDVGDSAIPRRDLGDVDQRFGGLSDFGCEVVREMNKEGIVVDVSHTAKNTMLQAIRLSKGPVVASHSCIRSLCDHPRNLDDMQLRTLADAGGVIQITAMPYFLRKGGNAADISVATLVDHIDYAVRCIGIAHVGISSDFDGGGGINGWMTAAETSNVTAELYRRGYSDEDVAALWGLNFLRVLSIAENLSDRPKSNVEPPARRVPRPN